MTQRDSKEGCCKAVPVAVSVAVPVAVAFAVAVAASVVTPITRFPLLSPCPFGRGNNLGPAIR
ncbi:hypothetical protein CTA1_5660 [Colletotrichum tanaceti]|uniref:Uncharacterized protein n=1 Tax=Colletotrichum tanaceti TaxID=1306861 RepID=A0A4U6X796_9PEZI|nr:hypothetical protein CTA1_5660 [Colletotrichum tanaceti]